MAGGKDEPHEALWRMVPPAEYCLPVESQPAVLRKRWYSLLRLLRGAGDEASPAEAETDLRALPQLRLANVAPPIDWEPAAGALQCALSSAGGDAPPGPAVRFLIGQPYGGHAAILAHVARLQGAEVLPAPGTEQILGADPGWLSSCRGARRPWVLPELERCFLRHANGLELLRTFLGEACSGALGEGVIGCDSWAWAFIQRAWPMPRASALTLQAFDGPALSALLLHPPGDVRAPARFRSARSGQALAPEPSADGSGSETASPELRQLAAHCRGNPGIAWHYWRKRLVTTTKVEPVVTDASGRDEAQQSERAETHAEDLVWLAPEMGAPVLPNESGEDTIFTLHALLLHDGLPAELLAELLPLSYAQIMSRLLQLEAHGIVDRQDGRWRVAALAYPTAREALRARSYLTDAF